MAKERLQKILARGGIASRRAAEELITSGRVRVNGKIVTELGAKADPRDDTVAVDGKRVVAEPLVYVILHKPRGYVSTMSDPEGRPTVRELLAGVGGRVYPVGRLDFATSGALLATNDGDFADGMLHPKRAVPKTYVLKVSGMMQEPDLERWRKGIRLEDGMTQPARCTLLRHEQGKTWLELEIKEGRNQQIRRMGEATRFPVMRLARVAFAGISTEGLRPGEWRALGRRELLDLKKQYGVPQRIPDGDDMPDPRPRGRSIRRDRSPSPRAGAPNATPRTAGASSGTTGPRYGGGAPGRRGVEVTEDWGGGARRGRSSDRGDDRAPRQDVGGGSGSGGRGGRTRTTGSGGGVGAGGGDDASWRIGRTRRR